MLINRNIVLIAKPQDIKLATVWAERHGYEIGKIEDILSDDLMDKRLAVLCTYNEYNDTLRTKIYLKERDCPQWSPPEICAVHTSAFKPRDFDLFDSNLTLNNPN